MDSSEEWDPLPEVMEASALNQKPQFVGMVIQLTSYVCILGQVIHSL